MPVRFITPQKLITERFQNKAEIPKWDAAIICFRDLQGSQALIQALSGTPVGRKVFWGLEECPELPNVYTADVAGMRIGIIGRCIWGGPQAAILVEELSAIGVRFVIGYGAAGSLDVSLCKGSKLVVCAAPATDGTSKQYGPGPFMACKDMVGLLPLSTFRVMAATVDAVYRETPSLVEHWRQMGLHVVNMEAAPFYASALACGVPAVWLGHVSDVLVHDWEDWYVDRRDMNAATIRDCLEVLHGMSKTNRRPRPPDALPRAGDVGEPD